LRVWHALKSLSPDHVHRLAGEQELSRLRKGIDAGWLAVVEPERAHLAEDPTRRPDCVCFEAGYHNRKWPEVQLHTQPQDTECDAWKRLLDKVERAAADQREEFALWPELSPTDRYHIVTLPPTIAKLKSVKRLHLYGSHLTRIPPEIGEMA